MDPLFFSACQRMGVGRRWCNRYCSVRKESTEVPCTGTELEEVQQGQEHGQISSLWAGGFDGMEVANELLRESEVRSGFPPPSSRIL